MKPCDVKDEDGFWSALVIIFVMTLTLMGLGSMVLIRSEGESIAVQAQAIQAEYATASAVYYGAARLSQGTWGSESFTIGGVTVNLDTFQLSGDTYLNVLAVSGDIENEVSIRLVEKQMQAIYTEGSVSGIRVYDSTATLNSGAMEQNVPELPAVDYALLDTLSDMQLNTQAGNWTATNNFPSASFYNVGVTPNVTHVTGNMTVPAGVTVYGIFMVDGNLTLQSASGPDGTIIGVVYMPNSTSTVTMGSWTVVNGGIMATCNIVGPPWWQFAYGLVTHVPDYTRVFSQFHDPIGLGIDSWTYEHE